MPPLAHHVLYGLGGGTTSHIGRVVTLSMSSWVAHDDRGGCAGALQGIPMITQSHVGHEATGVDSSARPRSILSSRMVGSHKGARAGRNRMPCNHANSNVGGHPNRARRATAGRAYHGRTVMICDVRADLCANGHPLAVSPAVYPWLGSRAFASHLDSQVCRAERLYMRLKQR
jgi:hypothetical protein